MADYRVVDKTTSCHDLDLIIKNTDQLRVIIALESKDSFEQFQSQHLSGCSEGSFTILRKMENLNMLVLMVTSETLQVLCADRRVISIRLDRLKKPAHH